MNGNRSPRRGRRTVTASLLGAILAVALPLAASADATLDTAQTQVVLDASGSAQVEINYRITGSADGETAQTVSFSSLNFDGAVVDDLRVTAAGTPLQFESELVNAKTTTVVTLPEALEPGQDQDLVLAYVVPSAGSIDGEELTTNVPILAMDNPAASSAPGTFTATVEMPAGHSRVEGFPSNTSDVTEAGEATVLHYSLPAVPAVLRTVSTEGEPSWWTTEALMETLLGLSIIAGIVALYFGFVRPHRRNATGTDQHSPQADTSRGSIHADKNRGL
ncbi:hypothetical protein [Ornithinimicrobium sediminis]|uniref:hypothetical protein n=1 Tax=Ornithinimicrobium sediminis TaxID=2904603 RepID=UPI001E340C70|nr:hypothetical protein [Ornithinimicrobium sediminis]MCE0485465.1 hypothetical protein [Ornithinimicrobium sediminis]